jgi:hypothetical protein
MFVGMGFLRTKKQEIKYFRQKNQHRQGSSKTRRKNLRLYTTLTVNDLSEPPTPMVYNKITVRTSNIKRYSCLWR